MERYVDDLLYEYPYDFIYPKLSVGGLLKSVGVCLAEQDLSPIERVLDYMQLIRDFDSDKLFVFVNMQSFFSEFEMNSFIKDALMRKFRLLLIDNREYNRLPGEKRYIIDRDLCEIILNDSNLM